MIHASEEIAATTSRITLRLNKLIREFRPEAGTDAAKEMERETLRIIDEGLADMRAIFVGLLSGDIEGE